MTAKGRKSKTAQKNKHRKGAPELYKVWENLDASWGSKTKNPLVSP